ncbi:MAG: hypothetical protein E7Z99_07605 [Coriobacteriaceae bacterium]|nr:hypothetical protein [Coriobacteriaceae bacterium]
MHTMLDAARIQRITRDKDQVIELFDAGDWSMLATYVGDLGGYITGHSRLLRSLSFGDEDYPACVAEVLANLVRKDEKVLDLVESMLREKGSQGGNGASQTGLQTFFGAGQVHRIEQTIDTSLVTAMMPFRPDFDDVRETMRQACANTGRTLKAADDIWESSVLIQDVINLIATSCMVIVDFTGKNPNVFYETGVAHALGKEVIPITQSLDDVPFDLQHHRVLRYDNNTDGRMQLQAKLEDRMKTIAQQHGWFTWTF